MFVGCQPESLHERHLSRLVRESYFVMDKTDGERFLLIGIPNKDKEYLNCYIINRWMNCKKVGLRVLNSEAINDGFLLGL